MMIMFVLAWLDDESKVKMVEVFIGIYGFYKQKRASLVLKESNKGSSFFFSFFLLGRLNESFCGLGFRLRSKGSHLIVVVVVEEDQGLLLFCCNNDGVKLCLKGFFSKGNLLVYGEVGVFGGCRRGIHNSLCLLI